MEFSLGLFHPEVRRSCGAPYKQQNTGAGCDPTQRISLNHTEHQINQKHTKTSVGPTKSCHKSRLKVGPKRPKTQLGPWRPVITYSNAIYLFLAMKIGVIYDITPNFKTIGSPGGHPSKRLGLGSVGYNPN